MLAGRPGAWGRPGACLAGLKCRKRRNVRGLARPGKLGALKKAGRSDVLEAWQVENLGRSGVLEAWRVENVGRSNVLEAWQVSLTQELAGRPGAYLAGLKCRRTS